MTKGMQEFVRQRANDSCEYCQLPQKYYREIFQIDHFEWTNAVIRGLTPIGRATVITLNLNAPSRIAVRDALIIEGVFPPGPLK